jgi:LysM repeat protein
MNELNEIINVFEKDVFARNSSKPASERLKILVESIQNDVAYKKVKERYDKMRGLYFIAFNKLLPFINQVQESSNRGFAQQKFKVSPLDDLAKLELSTEEDKNETWQSISKRTGISVADLMKANPKMSVPRGKVIISKRNGIKTSSDKKPIIGGIRVVKATSGDTIAKIALRYGVNAVEVANLNGMSSVTTTLSAGQAIKISVLAISSKQNQYTTVPINKELGAKPKLSNGKVDVVMNFFNENMNDPYSMRFVRWFDIVQKNYQGKLYWSVQVKFRAKNAFGAYVLSEMIFYIKNNKVVATETI